MINNSHDVTRVAVGTLVEMHLLHGDLAQEGILSRVVGDALTAGLGTALPGSVELWVLTDDFDRAEKIVERSREHHRSAVRHERPESERMPESNRIPHHAPTIHRSSP